MPASDLYNLSIRLYLWSISPTQKWNHKVLHKQKVTEDTLKVEYHIKTQDKKIKQHLPYNCSPCTYLCVSYLVIMHVNN